MTEEVKTKCFALDRKSECKAAKEEYADEIMGKGACGTTDCIFYKPDRKLMRIGKKFYPAKRSAKRY